MLPDEAHPLTDADLEIIEAQEVAEREEYQLALYEEKVFSKTHPKPVQPLWVEYQRVPFDFSGVSFMEEYGVEARINMLATVGGILFSAIRTAGIFAVAEARLLASYAVNPTVSTVISWLAGFSLITVIEGVLAGFGWVRGRKSGDVNTSWTPIVVAGAIAALAGVLPSFELVSESATKDRIFNFVMWVLVLLSGPGIAYLIYVVTENFGHLHNAWEQSVRERIEKHEATQNRREAEHIQRQEELQQAYRRDIDTYFALLQEDYRKKGRAILFGQSTYNVKRDRTNGTTPKPASQQATPGVTELVRQYLAEHDLRPDQVGEGDGFVISPMGIAQAMQIFKKDGVTYNNSAVRTALSRMR